MEGLYKGSEWKREVIEAQEEEKRMGIGQEEDDCEGMIYNVRKYDCNVGKRNKTLHGYLSWR